MGVLYPQLAELLWMYMLFGGHSVGEWYVSGQLDLTEQRPKPWHTEIYDNTRRSPAAAYGTFEARHL